MRVPLLPIAFLLLATVADSIAAPSKAEAAAVAAYDALLAGVTPEQTTIALGDMIVPVSTVRLWRDQLAGTAAPGSASQTGVNKWTGGIVYYEFDASVIENATVKHRTATLDAMAEWSTFANVTFTPRVAQPNYILVKEVAGLGGGVAALGMVGGAQQFDIGPAAWNRGTLLHELGHTLGLIHEHQRGDGVNTRNNFVTIRAAVAGDGNFVLVPTSTGNGPYDFLSVMHYARNTFAPVGVDNITPKAGYTQFIDIMGNNPDRLLSRGDRNGIAIMYPPAAVLTTVVTNTKDSGPGSLRAAIYKAFDIATDTPGATPTITFQIPNTDPNFAGGVFTIRPTALLTSPGTGTTIDATTQTAFTGDSNASGPEVVLNGGLQVFPDAYGPGLRLSQTNVTVKGFVINGFTTNGVLITAGATGNTVAGCYIGTNASGTAAVANVLSGVEISAGATGNRVGGTTAAARNVISGNAAAGVFIRGAGTSGNFIEGSYLGLNAAGTGTLANAYSGVEIGETASANTIGGTTAGSGNVLSGNTYQGIYLHIASGNTVAGNLIGTNAAGTAALANGAAGIEVAGASQSNTIGGSTAAARNVISGNTYQGVLLAGSASVTGNTVAGNFIGTNAAGTTAIPNAYSGVGIFSGATANTIGTGNVISGNANQGIYIGDSDTNANVVTGNLIGLNAAGAAALANGYAGVEIGNGAQTNVIGGTTASARNVISGNSIQGVYVNGLGTSGNRVSGNYIGTNATGTGAVANGYTGVDITNRTTVNIIGGTAPGAGNVISGNAVRGATITDALTTGNVFTGNLIGLNAAGTAALPNAGAGIQIFGGAQGNTIGSITGGRNFISGNNGAGVTISGNPTGGNFVIGNSIGTTPAGTIVANTSEGIALFADGSGGTTGNVIGGSAPGAANLISGNATSGVGIYNAGTTGNRVSGNSIVGNGGRGIDLGGNGVTANDANDTDTGPNNIQNFPVLTSAVLGTGTTVIGTLNSTASAITYRVEFFENTTGDSSGNGEGQNFIGAIDVLTSAAGAGTINTTLPAIVPAGHVVTATARDPAGNTSEFSQNRTVTTTDADADGLPDAYEIATWTNLTSATGAGDSDGDGMTNAQEFRAGTNPRDPLSVFRLAPPATAGADKTLSLTNFAGRTYRIDYADILATPTSWRILADQIPGTGSAIIVTDPGAAALPLRFYRAVVLP